MGQEPTGWCRQLCGTILDGICSGYKNQSRAWELHIEQQCWAVRVVCISVIRLGISSLRCLVGWPRSSVHLVSWEQRKVCWEANLSMGSVGRGNSETQTTVLGRFIGISGESFSCPRCHTLYYYRLWLGMGSCIVPSLKPTQNCRVRVWNKTSTSWCRVFLLMAKCGFREGELGCLKGKKFFQGNILIIQV